MVRGLTFSPDRTLVMGILNVTPDSFSDGGRYGQLETAVAQARALFAGGADIVDVGGESTRPGADPVDAATERERVLPIVEALSEREIGPISVDTYKAEVARAAVAAGAVLVNDISGGTFDPDMLPSVGEIGAGLVLSHARGRPSVMQQGSWSYPGGVVEAVSHFLADRVAVARSAGVTDLILDPGIGFGKTLGENLDLLRNLDQLRAEDLPILVGTSRKGFIGTITGRPVEDREFGTAATMALAIASGADMVRVHDVAHMIDVVRVADAWVRGEGNQ